MPLNKLFWRAFIMKSSRAPAFSRGSGEKHGGGDEAPGGTQTHFTGIISVYPGWQTPGGSWRYHHIWHGLHEVQTRPYLSENSALSSRVNVCEHPGILTDLRENLNS